MDISKVDLHIHTIACGHGLATVYEIIEYSNKKDMKIIGINEHAPSEGTQNFFFPVLARLPRKFGALEVWRSCEFSFNSELKLDLREKDLDKLDYFSVSVHTPPFTSDSKKLTETVIDYINKYKKLKFICHPCLRGTNYDIEKVTKAACDNGILMELNNSTYSVAGKTDENCMERTKTMVEICKENKMPLLINSDAHVLNEIGNFDAVYNLLSKLKLQKKDIINFDIKRLKQIFEME